MKRSIILFAIFFVLTLVVPMFAAFMKSSSANDTDELVTIFSGAITPLLNCHLPL